MMLSIVIPNLNSPVIGEVLASIRAEMRGQSEAWEVWVVGQDHEGRVSTDRHVHLLTTPVPVPPARARNLGASAARGDVLVFLDADCIPQPGWLSAMLAAARRPEVGAVSGAMLPDGDTFAAHCGQIASFHEHLSLNSPARRRTLASFSLLVPRAVWQTVEGFDERFQFAAAEDLDLSIRIAQNLELFFEPRAVVRHKPQRRNWRSLWQHAYRGGTQSAIVRHRYAGYYQTPTWTFAPWIWFLFSPVIALGRAWQIYAGTPGLWRYWRCAPWVFLSKLAWCWGAAAGLARLPIPSPPKHESQGEADPASQEAR